MIKNTFLYICFCLWLNNAFANDMIDAESQYIAEIIMANSNKFIPCTKHMLCSSNLIESLYTTNHFMPLWENKRQISSMTNDFIDILKNSYRDGLNPDDYHLSTIQELIKKIEQKQLQDENELIEVSSALDLTLSDALLLYASNMLYGKVNNKVLYPHWKITKRSINLLPLLLYALQHDNLKAAFRELIPQNPQYAKLKEALAQYQQIAKTGSWKTIPGNAKLAYGMVDERVLLLQKRLLATGELQSLNKREKGHFNAKLKHAVKLFQHSHGISEDGEVGKITLQALNIPVMQRLLQIKLNMDRLRWLPTDLASRYVLVNIPNYSLVVVDDGQTILSMPVIVGKTGLQSCVISSQINAIELNPYWYVPNSIVIKEYLPKLQESPNFLADNDMQLFDRKTNQKIDPLSIEWKKVETRNFPYLVRQEYGEDNALGQIKFVFPNNCGIYLHDTPGKELFKKPLRAMSHGCIRVGEPLKLAAFLMQNQSPWNESAIVNTIDNNKHKVIMLKEPTAIYIIYATVWVDDDEILQFRNDIYHIENIQF